MQRISLHRLKMTPEPNNELAPLTVALNVNDLSPRTQHDPKDANIVQMELKQITNDANVQHHLNDEEQKDRHDDAYNMTLAILMNSAWIP